MQDQSFDPVPALIRDIVSTNHAHGRVAALALCERGLEAFPGDPRLLAVASGLQPVLALWVVDPRNPGATTAQEARAWLGTPEARRRLGEWVFLEHQDMLGHGPTRDDIAALFQNHPDGAGLLVEEELLPAEAGGRGKAGVKADAGKQRWDLLPMAQVGHVVDVLTFGADKYSADGWKDVPGGVSRYYAATLRHLAAWHSGETADPESGLPHLAHAACCILFLLWFERDRWPPAS